MSAMESKYLCCYFINEELGENEFLKVKPKQKIQTPFMFLQNIFSI